MTSKHDVRVIFYACQAGWLGDSSHTSFAKNVSLALKCTDAKVFGHEVYPYNTTGDAHTASNPYVTVFEKNHVGDYVINPKSPNWKKWERAMSGGRHQKTRLQQTLWARFPFMTKEAIESELAAMHS